eukprot:9036317-Alexandrium_andersonii.AAC.1
MSQTREAHAHAHARTRTQAHANTRANACARHGRLLQSPRAPCVDPQERGRAQNRGESTRLQKAQCSASLAELGQRATWQRAAN